MTKYIVIGLGALVFILALTIGIGIVSYYNSEKRTRNHIAAQQDANRAVYDNTWKIIQQQAGVADKYQESFREIYSSLMSERYKQGEAQLLKLVVEANPNFDSKLFEKLMDSIETQRNVFTRSQIELRALKQEHDNLIGTFPGNLFLFWVEPIDVTIVTSSRTEKAFETGQDDDTEVFKK